MDIRKLRKVRRNGVDMRRRDGGLPRRQRKTRTGMDEQSRPRMAVQICAGAKKVVQAVFCGRREDHEVDLEIQVRYRLEKLCNEYFASASLL